MSTKKKKPNTTKKETTKKKPSAAKKSTAKKTKKSTKKSTTKTKKTAAKKSTKKSAKSSAKKSSAKSKKTTTKKTAKKSSTKTKKSTAKKTTKKSTKKKSKEQKITYFVGVDEVGRGPLAGPVMVAACGVSERHHDEVKKYLLGITDSKKLSEQRRNFYFKRIKEVKKRGVLYLTSSSISASVVDKIGISKAIEKALKSSLRRLGLKKEITEISLDGGLKAPKKYEYQKTIIRGDQKNWLIATASVFAKVTRDKKMKKLHDQYPDYNFAQHKGYGTKEHKELIKKHGVSPVHRKKWIK